MSQQQHKTISPQRKCFLPLRNPNIIIAAAVYVVRTRSTVVVRVVCVCVYNRNSYSILWKQRKVDVVVLGVCPHKDLLEIEEQVLVQSVLVGKESGSEVEEERSSHKISRKRQSSRALVCLYILPMPINHYCYIIAPVALNY